MRFPLTVLAIHPLYQIRTDVFNAAKEIRVEIIALLYFSALGILELLNDMGTYRVICYHTIGDNAGLDCYELGNKGNEGNKTLEVISSHETSQTEQLEDKVQQAAVTWNLIFQLCRSIPALFADATLGAFGDHHGRQVNILIGLMGMIVSVYPLIIVLSVKSAPFEILIIGSLISGLTGYMSIIMISSFAYLADTVVDHKMLTVRMTYFSAIMNGARIFSPLLGGWLLKSWSYARVGLCCQAILVSAFFSCLFIVKQRPPLIMRKIMLEKYVKDHGHQPPAYKKSHHSYHSDNVQKPDHPNQTPWAHLKSIFVSVWRLWREVYQTYIRQRTGNARTYLLFACFAYFLNATFENGVHSSVFSLYIEKSPFNWGDNEIANYQSISAALHLVGSVIGVVIMKKWLQLHDTTIVLIAMGTHVFECVLFAFAKSADTLYLAAACGCLSLMTSPCIKSFITKLVDADEVGKSFAAFGMAMNVASIFSNVLYSTVYRATVSWFANFAFLLAAELEFLCIILFLWLHIDYHFSGSIIDFFKRRPRKTDDGNDSKEKKVVGKDDRMKRIETSV